MQNVFVPLFDIFGGDSTVLGVQELRNIVSNIHGYLNVI